MGSFAARSVTPELMDDPAVSGDELTDAFLQLETINRLLGGHATTLAGLQQLLPAGAARFSFLDVGCGGGDTLDAVDQWAVRRGLQPNLRGVELTPVSVELARQRLAGRARIDQRNLFDLAPESDSVDITHLALVLHHLPDEEIVRALSHLKSLSRVGIIVNDLHRHPVAHQSIRVLTRAISRNRLIRNDAPLSVCRAFTRAELQTLAKRAGLACTRLQWRWAFRWLLTCRTDGKR